MTTSNIMDEWRLAREALIQRCGDKSAANELTIRMTSAFAE